MTRNELKQLISGLKKVQLTLTDAQASETSGLFPKLTQNGSLVKAGTRINYNGRILKVAVDLWDTVENSPENAPTLYEELEYKDGIRIIPDVITVTKAFALNELGWWKDELYKSLISSNVYTPEAYPAGWQKID